MRSLNLSKNLKSDSVLELLAYHELVKHELIVERTKSMDKILIESILKVNSKDISYLYLIDSALKDSLSRNNEYAPILLERELNIINDEGLYKYLPIYYNNKLIMYKEDENIQRDIKSKLKAINQVNKIGPK